MEGKPAVLFVVISWEVLVIKIPSTPPLSLALHNDKSTLSSM